MLCADWREVGDDSWPRPSSVAPMANGRCAATREPRLAFKRPRGHQERAARGRLSRRGRAKRWHVGPDRGDGAEGRRWAPSVCLAPASVVPERVSARSGCARLRSSGDSSAEGPGRGSVVAPLGGGTCAVARHAGAVCAAGCAAWRAERCSGDGKCGASVNLSALRVRGEGTRMARRTVGRPRGRRRRAGACAW